MPTLKEMLEDGTIPMKRGVWIDVYNHSANSEISGTILTRIDSGNYHYVTEITACDSEGRR